MNSTRSLVFRGNLPWPMRLLAGMLIPVHLATAVPAAVVAAAVTPEPQGSQQPPPAAFQQQHLSIKPQPPAIPKFAAPTREQNLSAEPTDKELMLVRGLEQPLLPMKGDPLPGENAALGKALTAYFQKPADDKPLTDYLTAFPQSRWAPALWVNLGLYYRASGRLNKGQDAFEKCWSLSKAVSSPGLKLMADRAVGELAEIYTDLREFAQLEALNKELTDRDVRGPGSAKVSDARARMSFLESLPVEKRNRCGPLAVRELFRYLQPGKPLPKGGPKISITEQGVTLSDLLIEAQRHGLDYQIAHRSPGAEVIFPSVVHWKAGHYTWLKKQVPDGYLSREAIFGVETNVSVAVLDEETSGYCLVPAGKLPAGWRGVTKEEAQKVMGSGITSAPSKPLPPCNAVTAKQCPKKCRGMTDYNLDLHNVALMLIDTPVGYQSPVGPAVEFTANYGSREEVDMSTVSNLGDKWACSWLCYLKDTSSSITTRYGPSGGSLDYYAGSTTGSYLLQRFSHDSLTKVSSTNYVLTHQDGSQEVFDVAEPGSTPRVFRSKIIDPRGNAIIFGYDSTYRIRTVTDALGKVTVVDYELSTDSTSADYYKITKVTDPYGRYAVFQYNGSGQLWKITDTIGIVSQFAYGTGDFVSTLTTPYGTTSFTAEETDNSRWLEAIDPAGGRERVEWENTIGAISDSESSAPSGFINGYLVYRNVFYWDKKAMAERPFDYKAAQITHFLHSAEYGISYTVESTKAPNEGRVWYGYAGQQQGMSIFEASMSTAATNQPIRVARMLDDGSEQDYYYEYNAAGKPTKLTDPLGRVTAYDYDTNNLDLITVRQKNGSGYDVLASMTYNTQHLPLTTTDASGQITSYIYNAAGQVRTVTNAKNETTTFWYHATGQPAQGEVLDAAATGYLVRIDGPVSGATTTFAYDNYGRVQTATDSQGYTVATEYDSFDRPIKVTYPDGTYEQVLYNRLDAQWLRDRLGRWTLKYYDANRHVVATVDSMYRKTSYDWCGCGSLNAIVDPAGNRTSWVRDIQGRITAKVYPDNTQDTFTYENTTSRLKKDTDAKGQVANYTYYLDNATAAVTYTDTTGAALSPATPGVSWNFDAAYPRVTSMTDGVGTTSYTYNPITSTPTLGAGRLATVTGPIPNSALAYTYDELGRVLTRSINGSDNTTTVHYDSLGRVDITTNALGTFTLAYVGVTGRLDHVIYPNGQQTNYTYYGNAATDGTGNGDQRLAAIQNLTPSAANLSSFGYAYDVVGQIATWSRQYDAATALTSSFTYDSTGQLLTAAVPSVSSVVKHYTYNYDLAGNRTQEQIGTGVTTSVHNNLNQLTTQAPGGQMSFAGALSEWATVTVGGQAATVDASNNWKGQASVTVGNNAIPLVATDVNGNATTKTINLVVSGGTARTLSYDLAGNETDNGAGQTYTYDALNRLKTITQSGNVTEFVYNGIGQRVQEKLNGTVIKQWVWDGGAQPVEEWDASGNVTKRFFGAGEQINGTNYYFTRDHLGSVREMTDASGVVRARYDCDPYGRMTKVSGDLEADFGFTGFYRHQASGLNLAVFRAYDPDLGRWTSRDPLGEDGGLNLYAYVSNNPGSRIDPLGLFETRHRLPDNYESSTVVTDGAGGFTIYYGVDPILEIPVVKNSVTLHERSHMLDALNQDSAIGNDKPAGLMLEASDLCESALTEIKATELQMDYLRRALADPKKYNLSPADINMIETYMKFLDGYLKKNQEKLKKCQK